MLKRIPILFAAALAVAATPAAAAPRPPVVLAAASLQEALSDAAADWARHGHPKPVISFAGSSALARQIDSGAPADLFISADEDWMNDVQSKGHVKAGTRSNYLANTLVLIAPASSRARVTIGRGFPLARALGNGRLAMADPDAVPAGKYGKAALTSLGVWPSVAGKVAKAENVRAALALVERGETPFGIVYATDAKASGKVRVVGTFPASSHPRIVYPMAILSTASSPDAGPFRNFLLSGAGKAYFARRGFTVR